MPELVLAKKLGISRMEVWIKLAVFNDRIECLAPALDDIQEGSTHSVLFESLRIRGS
jgi:hypothetical protein